MPPPPPAGSHLPRWEHYGGYAVSVELSQLLNVAGANGWELVTSDGREYCFKRPLLEASDAPAPAALAAPGN
jgi:hypothetical protein